MRIIVTLLLVALPSILAFPTVVDRREKFVPFAELRSCPPISPRDSPRSVNDVRPDDISVFMAVGDSITAGFLARSSPDDPSLNLNSQDVNHEQTTFSAQMSGIPLAREYRGLSYPIGGDPGAITIPNILFHWRNNLTGMSTGHHPLLVTLGGRGVWEEREDGLNAAISGSKSSDLIGQVKNYLLPKIKEMNVEKDAWKFVNIGIGGNDLMTNATGLPFVGTPQEFARGIKHAVDVLRTHVPNVIVNIIGLFRISTLYELTVNNPYCRGPFLPPLPRLPLECSCALLPGPAGDYTRQKMDELGEAYNAAVLEVIQEWRDEKSESFGVIWQPGSMIGLKNWPIEALSPVDCFHPSEAAHQRLAAGLWNRLTWDVTRRGQPLKWDVEVKLRCLEASDRLVLWT